MKLSGVKRKPRTLKTFVNASKPVQNRVLVEFVQSMKKMYNKTASQYYLQMQRYLRDMFQKQYQNMPVGKQEKIKPKYSTLYILFRVF